MSKVWANPCWEPETPNLKQIIRVFLLLEECIKIMGKTVNFLLLMVVCLYTWCVWFAFP